MQTVIEKITLTQLAEIVKLKYPHKFECCISKTLSPNEITVSETTKELLLILLEFVTQKSSNARHIDFIVKERDEYIKVEIVAQQNKYMSKDDLEKDMFIEAFRKKITLEIETLALGKIGMACYIITL